MLPLQAVEARHQVIGAFLFIDGDLSGAEKNGTGLENGDDAVAALDPVDYSKLRP